MVSFEDAMKVVARMELMAYFNTVSPEARTMIAEELMAMVNWPEERVVRNGHGVVPYVEPKDRLAWLVQQLKKVSAWPGMPEIRGIYCLRFTPADGVFAECDRVALVVTDDGKLVGNDPVLALEAGREKEQAYLPGPDDEPIGDVKDQIAGAANRLGGGR